MIIYINNLINQKTKLLALEILACVSTRDQIARTWPDKWEWGVWQTGHDWFWQVGEQGFTTSHEDAILLALSLDLKNIKLPSSPNHFYNKTTNPFPLIYEKIFCPVQIIAYNTLFFNLTNTPSRRTSCGIWYWWKSLHIFSFK